jgi:hypothetical protein
MSKKIIGGLVIVAAVGAGGFLYNQKMNEANVKIEAALNEQISIIEEANPNFDVDYKDYKINIDKTVVVNGITLKMKDTMKTIPIGDLKIADFDYSNEVPYFYSLELHSTINDELLEEQLKKQDKNQDKIKEIYSKIKDETGNVHVVTTIDHSYDDEKKTTVQKAGIDIKNAFGLSTSFSLSSFDLIKINALQDVDPVKATAPVNPMDLMTPEKMEVLGKIKIEEIYIELTNNGIVDIVMEMDAKKNNIPLDQYKRELSNKLVSGDMHELKGKGLDEYAIKFDKFLNTKNKLNTIYVKINPEFDSVMSGFNYMMMVAMQGGSPEDTIKELKKKLNITFDVK